MLYTPPGLPSILQTHVTDVTNETATYSISVTAGTSPNKNATYTTLIATTSYDSYGIAVQLAGLQTAATANQRCLVDIAVGAASSERIIVPDLTCGNVADQAAASAQAQIYYFPIYIPAGVRISATAAASTSADVVNVAVRLFQHKMSPDGWFGQRVTAYGVDAANVRGTSHSPGNGSYAAATQLTASTTNPIRAMQLGYDLLSDTTGATARGLARIGVGAGPTYVASELPFKESTTIETVDFTQANLILSHMRFNIPSGQSLHISAMRNATAEGRGFIVYGVD